MNLPNTLTLLRMALAPVFLALFVIDNIWTRFWAMVIFILAAVTDFVDGYYARKYNITTSFGKFADPLADKILVSLAFISFVWLDYVEAWMVLVIILREFAITGLRTLAAYKGVVISPTRWAKAKTFMQMTAIVLVLLYINYATYSGPSGIRIAFLESPHIRDYIYWLMFATVFVTVATGIDYIVKSAYLLKNVLR